MSVCGHTRHVGTCPACQRAQLTRWRTQLIAASDASLRRGYPPRAVSKAVPSGEPFPVQASHPGPAW